jgi:lipoprotein-anchoring transpeptidase ErfK/SrfK
MGKLIRYAFAALVIMLTSAPTRAVAQTAAAIHLPPVPLAATSPVAATVSANASTASASPSVTVSPAAPATPVSYYQRPTEKAYYSRPTTPSASYAAPPTPAAVTTPVASAIPAAAATAIAAIIPPSPSAPAASASSRVSSSPPASADHETEGLRLYLSDPVSATSNPLNWSFKASKSHHEAEVFYKGRLYKTYRAVFGRSRFAGAKQWEGDRRTPEGNYLIVSKHRSGRFRWFLKINYPNAADHANFDQMQAEGDIPRGLREGGAVGIHGTDTPILNLGNVDWTTGCISVDNAGISELARLLPIGTLVVIKP